MKLIVCNFCVSSPSCSIQMQHPASSAMSKTTERTERRDSSLPQAQMRAFFCVRSPHTTSSGPNMGLIQGNGCHCWLPRSLSKCVMLVDEAEACTRVVHREPLMKIVAGHPTIFKRQNFSDLHVFHYKHASAHD